MSLTHQKEKVMLSASILYKHDKQLLMFDIKEENTITHLTKQDDTCSNTIMQLNISYLRCPIIAKNTARPISARQYGLLMAIGACCTNNAIDRTKVHVLSCMVVGRDHPATQELSF